jgi:hypothetical protein
LKITEELFKALQGLEFLKELKIGVNIHNVMFSERGKKKKVNFLFQLIATTKVPYLDISRSYLTGIPFKIKLSPHLRTLHMKNCNLGRSLYSLQEAINEPVKLETLSLNGSCEFNQGFLGALMLNRSLRSVDLRDCNFFLSGISSLQQAFPKFSNTTLTEIFISPKEVTKDEKGMNMILHAVKRNLKVLYYFFHLSTFSFSFSFLQLLKHKCDSQ